MHSPASPAPSYLSNPSTGPSKAYQLIRTKGSIKAEDIGYEARARILQDAVENDALLKSVLTYVMNNIDKSVSIKKTVAFRIRVIAKALGEEPKAITSACRRLKRLALKLKREGKMAGKAGY